MFFLYCETDDHFEQRILDNRSTEANQFGRHRNHSNDGPVRWILYVNLFGNKPPLLALTLILCNYRYTRWHPASLLPVFIHKYFLTLKLISILWQFNGANESFINQDQTVRFRPPTLSSCNQLDNSCCCFFNILTVCSWVGNDPHNHKRSQKQEMILLSSVSQSCRQSLFGWCQKLTGRATWPMRTTMWWRRRRWSRLLASLVESAEWVFLARWTCCSY